MMNVRVVPGQPVRIVSRQPNPNESSFEMSRDGVLKIVVVVVVVGIFGSVVIWSTGLMEVPLAKTHVDGVFSNEEYTYDLIQSVDRGFDRYLADDLSLDEVKIAKAHWDSVLVEADTLTKRF